MKRSLNILLVSLLSLMVVFLSVGTTFMHCLRSGTVKMGVVEMMAKTDCCAKKNMEPVANSTMPVVMAGNMASNGSRVVWNTSW